ncbi:Mediator of RNA polymerase II transcription subunit 13 [Cercospora zeina]
MDFLKACTTNIYAIESVSQVQFVLYQFRQHNAPAHTQWSCLNTTLAGLRADNVLCAAVGPQLYVFGNSIKEDCAACHTLQTDFEAIGQGTVGERVAEIATGSLRDALLAAVELSVAHNLSKDPAITHIAPWTWLYANRRGDEVDEAESLVIKLRVRTTSTDGFYLISDVLPTTLQPVASTQYSADDLLVLAPFGQSAQTLPPDSRKSLLDGENWRTIVGEMLPAQGLELPRDIQWISIEPLDGTDNAWSWPAHLCFTASANSSQFDATFAEARDWRRWFISTEEGAIFRNPLAVTEEWYKGFAERERIKTAADVPLPTEAPTTEQALPMAAAAATPLGAEMAVSPSFTQRGAEHLSAMVGIYPTPPDGFAPAQPGLLTAATPSVTHPEPSSSILSTSPNESMQPKPPPQHAPLPHDPGELDSAQDDLFGDVGEIGFGDAEIDDADFNFFDEPDDDFAEHPQIETSNVLKGSKADAHARSALQLQESAFTGEASALRDASHDSSMCQHVLNDTKSAISMEKPTSEESAIEVKATTEPGSRWKRPLSPFGIREQLLPPPVPASHSHSHVDTESRHMSRRDSSFTSINFRDSMRVASMAGCVTLPPTRSTAGVQKITHDTGGYDDESSESEDSYESSTSEAEELDLPPRLPWETKKRKRLPYDDASFSEGGNQPNPYLEDDEAVNTSDSVAKDTIVEMLQHYLPSTLLVDFVLGRRPSKLPQHLSAMTQAWQPESLETLAGPLPPLESAYALSKSDLICVAQIVAEQSITANVAPSMTAYDLTDDQGTAAPVVTKYLRDQLALAVRRALPEALECDLSELALSKESLLRQTSNSGKMSQGQPRLPQRLDSAHMGPDYFTLPTPFLRLRRGRDAWEMLPACIPFWETLGLSPAAGPKHLRAFCVFPFNEDLQRLVDHFLGDLGTAYENCKLGTHVHLRNVSEIDEHDNFEDGMAPVELGEDASLEAALKSYATTCSDLGKALSTIAHQEAEDRAIVVYILNPFSGEEARQHLCACFWNLFQTYRDNMPRMPGEQGGSDIFLQLLPISLVAAYDAFVPLDARKMSVLAREIYDRCPPTSALQLSDIPAPLPNLAAPTVELASMAPKRLGFQLIPEAATDLLYEGSVLHVAYACSSDGRWLTASWIDSTGKYLSSSAFCMVGRTFAETAEEVWEHTKTIMAARQVSWRVFVVAQDGAMEPSIMHCWRMLAAKPRAQPVCVTMLSVQSDPLLQLLPPYAGLDHAAYGAAENGVLTPASTPQGATFTSSPDVAGHGGNTPLTPAPSDTATSLAADSAGDADAQLTDMTDETWGVLLTSKLSGITRNSSMAHGVLLQRGKVALHDTDQVEMIDKLPSLGVNIHWTIQVKPQGTVDEGSIKQAELTLREVLRMFRGLSLLTKARNLECDIGTFAPLHIATAVMGAAGLDGLLLGTEGGG